jgi:cation transport regulator
MPYDRNADLPDSVRNNLPEHAQTIYREAFNSAFEEYKSARDRRGDASREETAHKVAWSAVKQSTRNGATAGRPKADPARAPVTPDARSRSGRIVTASRLLAGSARTPLPGTPD